MGQNQWYHFGVGAPPILVYFSRDLDFHWVYDLALTHGLLEIVSARHLRCATPRCATGQPPGEFPGHGVGDILQAGVPEASAWGKKKLVVVWWWFGCLCTFVSEVPRELPGS